MSIADYAITGEYNPDTNTIQPKSDGTWSDLTDWTSWGEWRLAPQNPLIWLTDTTDLGESQIFNLEIGTTAQGTASYRVFTSDTGRFSGEETETVINQGDTAIPSYRARYCAVLVFIDDPSGNAVLENVTLRANNRTLTLSFSDLDTSTLSGTVDSRVLQTSRTISGIENLQITPHETAPYTLDQYVGPSKTDTQLVSRIINKDALTFKLVGLDGVARDGVVDCLVRALPEQFMQGNSVKTR